MATLYVEDGYTADDYVQDDITIYWGSKVIFVPKFASIQIQTQPTEIRQLDLDVFRLALKSLEDSSDGMAFERTHQHNTTVTVGGATLARVIEIINGYTVTFEDGPYAINLVGANSNVGDVVNVNNVSVRSSNSAGLQDLNSLQAASFDGAVTVNTNSAFGGTTFPVGTRQYPASSLADATAIAENRGLRVFNIVDSETLSSIDYSSGYIFRGDNPVASTLTVLDGANVEKCEFVNIYVTGVLDNNNLIRQCAVGDMMHINGFMFQSALLGTITLGGNVQATLLDCYSGIAGNDTRPIIDMGGSGQSIALRGYKGGLELTNCTDTTVNNSLDIDSGTVIFSPSITAGTFVVRGVCTVVNNSTGTANVIDETVNAETKGIADLISVIPQEVWQVPVNGVVDGSFGEAVRVINFQGAISVDANAGVAGTAYPLGTPAHPVNNMLDAITIGVTEGIYHIKVAEDVIVPATAILDGFWVEGAHSTKSEVTINDGASTSFSQFSNASLKGTFDGWIDVRDCMVEDLFNVQGLFHQTMINPGTIQFTGTQTSHFLSCYSGVPGTGTPEFDFNYAPVSVAFRGYNGGIKLTNKSQAQDASLDVASGQVILDSTVTAGTIVIRGHATVTDNSNGSAVVIDETINSHLDIQDSGLVNILSIVADIQKYDTNRTKIDENAFTLTVYDDDGTTPLTVYDLKDRNGVASVTEIFERMPR